MKWIAHLLLVAVLMTACGGSATTDASSAPASGDADSVGQALDLVDRLGSDAAATDALLLAMDAGYSGEQILGAVDDGTLQPDGSIADTAPAGEDLGVIELALGPGPETGDVVLAAFRVQLDRTPIEELRANAARVGRLLPNDGIDPEGAFGAYAVIDLLNDGFAPEDVVEILIFGIDRTSLTVCSSFQDDPAVLVGDEWYCASGLRIPASEFDDERADASTDATDAPSTTTTDDANDTTGTDDEPQPILIDGIYEGPNNHPWSNGSTEVLVDVVRIEVQGGAVTGFVYERDLFRTINMSSSAEDWFEGAQCEYLTRLEWKNDGPAAPVLRDEVTMFAQPGQIDFWLEFPDCARGDVPVSQTPRGDDTYDPAVGSFLISQAGDDVLLRWDAPDGGFLGDGIIVPRQ